MTERRTERVSTLRIAPLREQDTAQSAMLHQTLLPHGLFPRLGMRFMRRWHRTFVDSPYGVALGAVDEGGTLHGFIVATTDQDRYTGDVLSSARLALAWRGMLALLVRPAVGLHFLRTRAGRYLRRLIGLRPAAPAATASAAATTTASTSTVGVVHAIACVPACRGQGVGAALLAEYDRRAADAGTPLVQLITRDADGAADFYLRQGWTVSDRRHDRDGHPVVQLDHVPGTP